MEKESYGYLELLVRYHIVTCQARVRLGRQNV